MKVLYFGTYDRAAPRNSQVVSCLRGAGVEVRRAAPGGLGRAELVARAPADRRASCGRSGRSARDEEREADVVLVGYPGHFDLPGGATRSRAADRSCSTRSSRSTTRSSATASGSARGHRRRGCCRSSTAGAFRSADLVVADTEAHAAFFRRAFGLREDRVDVALVGAEEALFRPGWQPPEPFHVLFVGKLIPLHGLDTILAAAALLPDVPFRVVGDGQLAPLLDGRPANVEHVQWIPYAELADGVPAAGCALGIFDTGSKAARVIPNKVFQASPARAR